VSTALKSVCMIADFVEPPYVDGVVNTVKGWADGVAGAGWRVTVFSSTTGRVREYCDTTSVVYQYSLSRQKRFQLTPSYYMKFGNQVARRVSGEDFDILHLHSLKGLSSVPFLLRIQRKFKKPKVVSCYSDRDLGVFGLRNQCFSAFTVPTRGLKDRLVRRGVRSDRIHIIPPCLDLQRFRSYDKSHARKMLGLPETGRYLGFAGHLKVGRGILDLLRAHASLKQKFPDLRLVLASSGYGDSMLISELKKILVCRDDIQELGQLTDPALFYNAVDAYVLPTRSSKFVLPIPLTIIEAMACGTPVVCSDASSSPIIKDRENGFVFESRNVQSLVDCIGMLLREPWLTDECVGRAGRVVKENYSKSIIVNRIVEMYENELRR